MGTQVVQCMAAAVLCHMTENGKVAKDLVHYGAISVVINLLRSQQPELLSRCAVILADLAGHSDQYQNLIAQLVRPKALISHTCIWLLSKIMSFLKSFYM